MTRRQRDDGSRKEPLIGRRSLLKAVGGSALVAGSTALMGSAAAQVNADTVVDLGEQGLESGDLIDPYLDDHFNSGTEVHIPPGTYRFEGGGLGGTKRDCALVGSPDGVVFERPGPDAVIRPTLYAESGTVRLENITVRGKRGEEQSRWRVGAAEGARMECLNVNLPDGTVDGSDSTGLYAGTDHAGTLWVKNCFFSGFGNVALYVSDPYKGGNGPVIVEDCDFVNTGMSALRFASDNSVCRGCYFEATERAPAHTTGWNQRGIKIDDPGTGVVIEDCDFNWSDVGAMAIDFDDEGEGGSGVMRNLRIYNDGGTTFVDEWGVDGYWEGKNIHLTGNANHDAPSHFETITGSSAESPNTDYAIWTPLEGDVEPTESGAGTSSGSSSGSSDGSLDHRILLEASPDNPDANLNVSFTTTGQIAFAGEAESGTDQITQNDDGTYTATSVEMDPGAPDSYEFDGDVIDYSVTDGYEVAVELDGQATTFQDLVDDGSGSGDDGSDGTDGTSDGDDTADGDQPAAEERIIIIDGTGDAEEVARYEFTVTGTVERDEERSVVVDGGTIWDAITDHVEDDRAVGIVGNGKDAYRFTANLDTITVDGPAGITILEG